MFKAEIIMRYGGLPRLILGRTAEPPRLPPIPFLEVEWSR